MAWQDWLTLAALAGVVVAIFMGRRKGRSRFAASVAAARAEGHAQATAELSAKLVNHVQVVAGNSLPGEVGRESDAIVAALRFLAVEQSRQYDPAVIERTGTDDLHDLLSSGGLGSDSGQHGDDEYAAGWGANTVDRSGAVRRVDGGSAVVL